MPVREDKRTGYAMKPKYVTIHNTGSTGKGANALAHANGQLNDSRTLISWHFTVDNTQIYQSMPMDEVGYHAGDGLNSGNGSTIGIEICENVDGDYAVAEKNAAYLTAQILYESNLPADAVRMHRDWSGKNCPHNIIEGTKGTMGWTTFKALVKKEYDKLKAQEEENTLTKELPEELVPYFEANNLVFNKGYVTGFKMGSTLKDVNDMFHKTQKTRMFISLEVKNPSGVIVPQTTFVSTGLNVTLKYDDKEVKFKMVLKGDVNGDGKIRSLDYVLVKNHILNINKLTKEKYLASDVSKCE